MIAMFNRFDIEMTLAQAKSASHQGQCDSDVAALVAHPKIARQLRKIPADDIRAELKEYGAWDSAELSNDAQNWQRIIWCAAGNIAEENA